LPTPGLGLYQPSAKTNSCTTDGILQGYSKATIMSARSTPPMWTLYCVSVFGLVTNSFLLFFREPPHFFHWTRSCTSHFCLIIHSVIKADSSSPLLFVVFFQVASLHPVLANGAQSAQAKRTHSGPQ